MAVSEEIRKEAIGKALESLPSEAETLRVPWRDEMVRMPVIRVPLNRLVLNPTSHRIKSQLESEPQVRKAIEEDPDGDEAQEAIADLLRETLGFEALKQNLGDENQREPAIITRQGRLINGNTRAVSLRDLGEEHMDVAVLPADASLGEIYELELDLQVALDYRQDYSFTNELLFVEDLITQQGRGEEEVALRLRWASPTKSSSIRKGVERVCRYVRHLSLIREIQEMSGGNVALTDFDDAEQALQEFDKAYEGLRDKDPPAAEKMKAARTLGLLVDLGYSRLREVNAAWVDNFLEEAIRDDPVLGAVQSAASDGGEEPALTTDDGLGEFEDAAEAAGDQGSGHQVVKVLVERLGQSAHADTVKLPTPEGEKEFDREEIGESVNAAMRAAAEDSRRAAKAGDELKLPIHLVSEASRHLVKARSAHDSVADRVGFEPARFRTEVDKARRALDALEQGIES